MPIPDKNGHYYFQSLCPDINKKKNWRKSEEFFLH
jgi:hypothetical protein